MNHTIRFTEPQWATLQSGLWARSDVETGAIVFAEAVPSSDSASLAVRKVIDVPAAAYRARKPDFMELDPVWMNQQCFEARRNGLSVFTAHTHLTDGPAWFSWADDAGDHRLMPALLAQMPDRLHGAVNVTRSDALARVYVDGAFIPAQISVAGSGLLVLPRQEPTETLPATHARQQLALGRQGQARLATTRVGVVGLGGTGSVVCMLLGRLGLRAFLLVDGDHLEAPNFSRVLESSRGDIELQTPKVIIAERALRAVVPGASIVTVDRCLEHQRDLDTLLACDVIFSCVDRLAPRALLNRLAYASHVPVVDMGSAFRVDESGKMVSQGGKVVVIGPGRPCLWCWGDLDAERIRIESLKPADRDREAEHGYITGADEPQPSVVTFNTTLAAAAVTEFVRMVTCFAGSAAPPDRINFDFEMGTATRARGRSRPGCRFCGAQAAGGTATARSDAEPRKDLRRV
ncbi:MAG: ThiF family adenylyltransferase [Polyangiaceae bacterium]